jgi:hypothetical protein
MASEDDGEAANNISSDLDTMIHMVDDVRGRSKRATNRGMRRSKNF